MEEALFRSTAAIRAKNNFPGKCFHAGQRVNGEEDSVVDSVELDRLPFRSFDDLWVSENGRGVAADSFEIIEHPRFRRGRLPCFQYVRECEDGQGCDLAWTNHVHH